MKKVFIILLGALCFLAYSCTTKFKDSDAETDADEDEATDPGRDDSDHEGLEETTDIPDLGEMDSNDDGAMDVPDGDDIEDAVDVEVETMPFCGDGTLGVSEECDDGDRNDCNGCSNDCVFERALHVNYGQMGAKIYPSGGAGGPCLTGNLTVEAWIKIDEDRSDTYQAIVYQQWGYILSVKLAAEHFIRWDFHMTSSNNLGKDVPVPGGISLGEWHHLAYTRQSAGSYWQIRTYFDGHEIDSDATIPSSTTWHCEGPMWFGNTESPTMPYPYSGAIDEVRLSNSVTYSGDFTPAGRLDVESGTQAYWDFNNDEGGMFLDVSGNGFDATIIDGTLMPDECHSFSVCGNGVTELGEECDDGNGTAGDGCENDCTFSCHFDSNCDDGRACSIDRCDTVTTHTCQNSLAPSSTVCRSAAGACDVTENCTGTSMDCPADGYMPSSYECRASGGVCDVAENCTGTSAFCPVDAFLPGSTECRASTGICDVAESCTGSSASCPSNSFRPSTYTCRTSADICDVAESCTGTSADCPSDVLRSSTYECRAQAGICDIAENCTGSSTGCPVNGFSPSTTVCRASTDTCDPTEYCTGSAAACPADVNSCPRGVIELGDWYSCAIHGDGSLWAWGQNADGTLGDGTTTQRNVPTHIGSDTNWKILAPDWTHTCALKTNGTLWCWGHNESGQFGDGTTTNATAPRQSGAATDWMGLASGEVHTCGLKTDNTLWCWGANHWGSMYNFGQLGDGTTVGKDSPVLVGSGYVKMSSSGFFACGIKTDGSLWCWGDNRYGQIGDGTTVNKSSPVRVGTDSDWAIIEAGSYTMCGIKTDGRLFCWGLNNLGQIGDGSTTNRLSPVLVGTGWGMVSAGTDHTCGIKPGTNLWCWGDNAAGAVGDGTTTTRLSPVLIGTNWLIVSSGNSHTCGIKDDGGIYCWGDNSWNQIGDGTSTNRLSPTYIGLID